MYHALIRTHHITSRKKVARLRQAAAKLNVRVLLRSGGSPGIMYVRGAEEGVRAWVGVVQGLRYKDFRVVVRGAAVEGGVEGEGEAGKGGHGAGEGRRGGVEEVAAVKEFGEKMEGMGVLGWWRRGMGWTS